MIQMAYALAMVIAAGASGPPTSAPATTQPHAAPAGVIRATGIGKPPRGKSPVVARLMAERAARVTALRNLARTAKSRQSRTGSVTIRNFRVIRKVHRPDGTVVTTVEWPAIR